jgi:hypothetical protein
VSVMKGVRTQVEGFPEGPNGRFEEGREKTG